MRLTKKQKEMVLAWVAEGLETDEINQRASESKKPFQVTRRMVAHYRATRNIDLVIIQKAGEESALLEGFAVKENRVKTLNALAALMEHDLLNGFLWTEQVKSIGSGFDAQVVDYEEFNKSEVEALRGVLDDIAREMGQRKTAVALSWEEDAKQRGYDPAEIRAAAQKAIAAGLIRVGDSGRTEGQNKR